MAKSRRTQGGFENPAIAESMAAAPIAEFESPQLDSDTANNPTLAYSAESELTVALSAADNSLLNLKQMIEGLLVAQASPQVEGFTFAADSFAGSGNIQGVGYCLGDASSMLDPGEPSLVVFTAEPASELNIKDSLANSSAATDEDLDATRMIVVQSGVIDAFAHRFSARPAPCGVSVGHFGITAGTLGALARGRSGERANRIFALSNNHVLANVNAGPLNANILQPGPADGGMNPQSRIGVLERFVPINFASGATNFVDCATAWMVSSQVRREFVRLVNGQQQLFRVSSQTVSPQVGMMVGKSGRTTQLTQGRISAIGVTVNVGFGAGRTGTFRDQISIVSTTAGAEFSRGGDSGSLIWTWNQTRNPVGLLFAGGTGVTFANRIDRVLNSLDIVLHT